MKGLALISIIFVLSTQVLWARSPHMSGKGHHRCHKPKARDCSQTYEIKSLQDLERYKEQTLLTGIEKDLRIRNSLEAQNLLIETSCEIRLQPHVKLKGQQTLKLLAKNIETTAHNILSGGDVILSSQKDFKLTSHSKLEATRLYLSSDKEIDLKNPSSIKAVLAILTAPKCEIHKRADVQITEKLGRCFGQNDYKISFVGAPLEGEIPLPVTFNTSGSFGLFDRIEYVFGDSETLETMSSEVTKHYESAGEFQAFARFYVNNTAVESAKIIIKAKAPVQTDFDIIYGITRTRPPQLIAYADKVPSLPNGVKEYIWDFGDSNTTTVNFLFDNFGTIFHDYQAEGIYKLSLKAKDQTDFVTAPVEKFIDTVNPTIPSPLYRISSFKGAAPFTVEVEALELTDPDGDRLEYQWRFTDTGQTIPYGNQRIVQHTFEREGIFQVQLFVRDSKAGYRGIPIPIYVGENFSVPSLPPVAVVDTTQRNGAAPLTVEFSSTRSFDPDGVQGQAMSYAWSFFDQTLNRNVQIFSQNFSYTFQRPGAYYPVLTITDVTGQRTSFRVPIFVEGEQLEGLSFLVRPTGSPRSFDISALDMLVANGYIADSMQWDFGDNSFFYGTNTIKTYQNPGSYTVKLKARKINGPYEEFTRTLVVEETPIPQSSFIGTKSRFNSNEAQEIEAILTNPLSDPEQVLYQWTLSSGLKVAGLGSAFKKITPIFTDRNPVQVTLYTQFPNGFSNLARFTIQPNQAPVISGITIYGAGDSAPVRIGAAPYEQAYDPDDFIKEYIYEWGDGSPILRTSNGYEEHTYQEAGSYTLKVTVVDDFGATASFSKLLEIRQNQKPIAGLTRIGQDLTAPTSVGFDAYQLSYDPDGFITEFEFSSQGQVILSFQGYQEFSFSATGSYQVSLRVKDNKGVWSDPTSLGVQITANQIPRVLARVDLIELVAPGRIGVELGESRDDDGWIEEFEFDFGDSTVSRQTSSYLAHTYQNAGVYTLKARVRDNKGAWSDYYFQTISIVENQKPIAGFSLNLIDLIAPAKIGVEAYRLSSDSDGFISLYEYSFGDGTSLTTTDGYVEHSYPEGGSFTITLRTQDNRGAWSEPSSQNITILENLAPIAGFTISKPYDIAPVQVNVEAWQLSKDNDGFIVNFEYSFGDGVVLTTPAGFVQHTYQTAGSYSLSVRVQDNEGKWSEPSIQEIVLQENKKPIADFNFSLETNYAPTNVQFNAQNLSKDLDGSIVLFEFNFGGQDKITNTNGLFQREYLVAGAYQVGLRVQDDRGAWSDPVIKEFVIDANQPPVLMNIGISLDRQRAPAIASIEVWPYVIDNDGYVINYEYNFGDGTIIESREGFVQHRYENAGTYLVIVRAQDNTGLWSNFYSKELTLEQNKIPSASIILLSQNLYAPTKLKFSAGMSEDSDGDIIGYTWTTSDGRSFTGMDVEVEFSQVGQYSIDLAVQDNDGGVGTSTTTFEVKQNTSPVADFSLAKNQYQVFEIINLESLGYDVDENQIITHLWETSDGASYVGKFDYHFFDTPGEHWIKLTLIDESGSSAEKTVNVTVTDLINAAPVARINLVNTQPSSNDVIGMLGGDGELSTSADGQIISYEWDLGDGTIIDGPFFSHRYKSAGTYTVKLKVVSEYGVIGKAEKTVNILSPYAPDEIESPFKLSVTNFDRTRFYPTTIEFKASLQDGAFHPDQESNVLVTTKDKKGIEVDNDFGPNLIKTNESTRETQIQLTPGKVSLDFRSYDINGNFIRSGYQSFYTGDRSVEVQLVSSHGSSVSEIPVTMKLLNEYEEVYETVLTDHNGQAVFNYVPPFNFSINAKAGNEVFVGTIDSTGIQQTLQGQVFPALTTTENNDLSRGLIDWTHDPVRSFIAETDVGRRIITTASGLQPSVYAKSFLADKSLFYRHEIDIADFPENSKLTIMVQNKTTGEDSIKVIDNEIYNELLTKKVEADIFANRGEIVHIKVILESKGVETTFWQKLFKVYANTPSAARIYANGIPGEVIKFNIDLYDKFEFNLKYPSRKTFEKMRYLSVGDFEAKGSIKEGNTANRIFGIPDIELIIGENSRYADFNFKAVKINNLDKNFLSANFRVDKNYVRKPGSVLFDIVDPLSEENLIEFVSISQGLEANSPISIKFIIELIEKDTGNIEIVEISKPNWNFPVDRLLVRHNNLNQQKNHYDGFGTIPFNLNQRDGGDFWVKPEVVPVLDSLTNSNIGFMVGDSSNLNGGTFAPHKEHDEGLQFDAVTRNFGSNGARYGLEIRSLQDLDSIISDIKGTRGKLNKILATFKEDSDVHMELKNRCNSGKSLNHYVENINGHKEHWHIDLREGINKFSPISFSFQMSQEYSYNMEPGKVEIVQRFIDPSSLRQVSFRIKKKSGSSFVKAFYSGIPDSFMLPYTSADLSSIKNISVVYEGGSEIRFRFDPKEFRAINEQFIFESVAFSEYLDVCDTKIFNLDQEEIQDCNNDGVKNDPALSTPNGGYIGYEIAGDFSSATIAKDARICGKNTKIGSSPIMVSGGVVLQDVEIGSYCSGINISTEETSAQGIKIKNAKLCTQEIEQLGSLLINGGNILIQDSSIDGFVSIFKNSKILDNAIIKSWDGRISDSIIIKSSVLSFTDIVGASVSSSNLNGQLPNIENNFRGLYVKGEIKNNSEISGIGYIDGRIDNGRFNGYEGFFRTVNGQSEYIIQHLFTSGSIESGGVAEQTGWIAGRIHSGGRGSFYSTNYHHSGVNFGASIGNGGNSNCFNYVEAGELRKSICHQVFNGSKNPDVMNIDSWKRGDPWPSP